ncbi:C40 family peptidase [Microtetraspora malaysiensis]|uniref:C40 family peptidase n=1 Tax=Microtetraspora malaysiensis TaxID=161358 RepID=UPI000B293457|nr:NlpC/P60 family protein [Microtetraspora malaysiensis]
MAGGAQRAALSARPDQLAAAVCAYAGGRAAPTDSGGLDQARQLGLTSRQAANAKTIVDMAAELGLPERAAVIGVATALQESELDESVVGDHGRAFGLMQQHPEYGWGSREQVTDPRYAARAFFSRLAKVEGWAGKPLTVVAQAVQRSAHPDAYAKHEARAGQIVTALTTSTTGPRDDVPKSGDDHADLRNSIEAAAALGMPLEVLVDEVAANLGGSDADRERAKEIVTSVARDLCDELSAADLAGPDLASVSARGLEVVRAALAMRGIPYSWGGGGPNGPSYGIGRGARTKGFDCSGLTEYAWAKAGVRIGTTTYEQWRAGARVPRSQVQPGDLLFYETDSSIPGPDHVGIAIDATRMVHAPFTGSTVRIDTWAGVPSRERQFAGAVRPS